MRLKGQNALEFIFTYSIVITIITVAVVIVLIFANAGRSIIPSQCSFFGGFACAYVVYTSNTANAGTSQLLLIATDTQPGVVNVSAFNAIIGSMPSMSGSCTPSIAAAGQKIYCIANFDIKAAVGTVYTGSFNIYANYCAQRASQLYNYSCPANSNYTYGGDLQLQATGLVVGGSSNSVYIPENVVNSQSSPTLPAFDLQIAFPSNTYQAYENGNLGNVRFYDGAKELYSWCESGCTNASSNTIFWVRMGRAIPPNNGAITLQTYFLPMSTGYDGAHAGEAPQLSSAYAQYDNGQNVFSSYQDWAGTAAPAGWTSSTSLTANVNDGATLTTSGGSGSYSFGTAVRAPFVADMYGEATVGNSGVPSQLLNMMGSSEGGETLGGGGTYSGGYVFGYGFPLSYSSTAFSLNTFYVISDYIGQSSQSYQEDYAQFGTTSSAQAKTLYAEIGQDSGVTTKILWWRIRAYPPNNVMPSVSFGSPTPVH